MKKLQARTTSEGLSYLNKYKVQNPIEITTAVLIGITDMSTKKPEEILAALDLNNLTIKEFAKKRTMILNQELQRS